MTTELRVSSDERNGWFVLRAEGEVDIASVEALQKEVDRALEAGARRILFDFEGVTFMDSTGLRTVVTCHQRLDEMGGEIAVVAGNGAVRRLFEVSGLEQSLPLYESERDATGS